MNTSWFQRFPWRSLGRWWIVGLAFYGGGLGVLYVFRDVLGLSLTVASLVAAELITLLRFLINDRWVFGHARPTWRRLWQYHVAAAGGSAIWWIVTNTLPRFGIHYLVASTVGTACSMFLSILTNFFWIWRGKPATAVATAPNFKEAGSGD
jgi:dolichol-phosphate mannosyltransferase